MRYLANLSHADLLNRLPRVGHYAVVDVGAKYMTQARVIMAYATANNCTIEYYPIRPELGAYDREYNY